ncbi:Cob(I)yrinic acid a,c-diamide adenosyltransferase [Stieleria bergensis]|uniref:Corrinoid adenosyltransferase n=1 Tax=Stieleria bergensis TaxID=2528025 RepID=A0A517SPK2_9BACT|nr:Cob(I)yrinic acid a,c-diamide adenosyltransferase [Planctomycetes bacterium SV_7m_r]
MKIYTRTGDSGSTGVFGGPRVPKDDIRIEAYGTVDELNAAIGCVRVDANSGDLESMVDQQLDQIQRELFSIGAELATPVPDDFDLRVIDQVHIGQLEQWIDLLEESLPPLKQFVLPGVVPAAAKLHLARAICRRAERRVITLSRQSGVDVSNALIIYLNRLSDYLFVLSRYVNVKAGAEERHWTRPS